jgi:hypothetical protein
MRRGYLYSAHAPAGIYFSQIAGAILVVAGEDEGEFITTIASGKIALWTDGFPDNFCHLFQAGITGLTALV